MVKRQLHPNQSSLFGDPVQAAMLAEWRDLSASERTDPLSAYVKALTTAPLPGQVALPEEPPTLVIKETAAVTLIKTNRPVIRSPRDVASLLDDMPKLTQEHMRVLLLTTKNHVMGIVTLYIGTVNTTLVRASEVFMEAVRRNCPQIIIAHNHPSGDPTPSPQDLSMTKQLREAGRLLDIDLMDHIVIGSQGFRSIKEMGWTSG